MYDDSVKAFVLKGVTVEEKGVKNCPKLRDVIYGVPLNECINVILGLTSHNTSVLFKVSDQHCAYKESRCDCHA